MIGPLIQLGFAVAYAGGALWLIHHEYVKPEKEKHKRIEKSGGNSKVNSVTLISANYKGKVKTVGKGIPISSRSYDWETCEFELKLAAAEANCNIVTNVRKEGNRRDGFRFSGIAYRKG